VYGCPVALPARAGDVGPFWQLLHLGFVLFCIGGGAMAGGHEPSDKWLCMGAWLCHQLGSEGPGEQVGGKGGTVGVPGRSPPPGVSPVVVQHTSHPLFKGRRPVAVGLLSGCCLAHWGAYGCMVVVVNNNDVVWWKDVFNS
jgi:hypothetical protein